MLDPTNINAVSTHYINFFMNYISGQPAFMGYTLFYYGLVVILTLIVLLRKVFFKERTA